MRVSTLLSQQLAVQSMLDRQSTLSKTQLQLSTGRRILTPADDPVDAALSLNLKQTIGVTEQYQRNADVARNQLGLEESTLEGGVNLLQRLRELAVQANNDVVGAEGRASIAKEVRERLDELLGLANTRGADGNYLFSGFQGQVQPFAETSAGVFTYSGDQGQRTLQIGAERQIAVGDSGSMIFMDIPESGGGVRDIFTTIHGFVLDLEANTGSTTILTDLDLAIGRLLEVQTQIGARHNTIESQQDVNSGVVLQLKATLSEIEDLDYTEAASRLNLDLLGLQAAQQAYVRVQGLSLFNFLN